jgi:peptidoglycan/LPS O-acetylase OafA/YrhL
MTTFKYRPDVDGLRAVAVGLVLLFHGGLGFTGGYIGVDVFFVISGFLITGLILRQQEAGKFSLANFWLRRIRRIIPAAAAMAILTLLAGFFLLLPHDFALLAESSVAHQFMLANVFFMFNTGYFAGDADTMPLLHTWSLAVEEQFYVFFPFVLLLLNRFTRRFGLIVLVIGGLASLALSQYGVLHYPKQTFYLLPTRAWELLIGGLIWYVPSPSRVKPWLLEILSWISLGAILAVGWFYSLDTPFPGFAALLPCAATVLLIYCNTNHLTTAGKLLALRPVVFVGLISYSLYLWHWPVLAYTRYWIGNELSPGLAIVLLALSVGLAVLSWRFVETPFRKGWPDAKPLKVVGAAVVSAGLIIGASLAVSNLGGVPERLPERAREAAAPIPAPVMYSVGPWNIRNGDVLDIGAEREPEETPVFILWGDSHAHAMQECFNQSAKTNGISGVTVNRSATLPLLGVTRPLQPWIIDKMPAHNDAVIDYIRETQVPNVILVGRWALNVEGELNGSSSPLLAETGQRKTDRETALAAMELGFHKTLDELEAAGAKVWILTQAPLQHTYPQRLLVRSLVFDTEIPTGVSIEEHQARQAAANAIIDRQVAGRDNVTVIDISPAFFNAEGQSLIGDETGSFYRDDDHVSIYGADLLIRPTLDTVFETMKTTD